MIQIAIIGFGNHITKNILPAIGRLSGLEVESIYVRRPSKYIDKALGYGIDVKGINESIKSNVKWIYISTPISSHYYLAKKFLEMGKNVICEKPLTDCSGKSKELVNLARNKELQLHEVCMYQYHKQYVHIKNTVSDNLTELKKISVRFTIPHLEKDDIRYNKELSGGALLDIGYYPVSLLVSLFGKPKSIKATKYSGKGYEVDLVGVAVFEYDQFYCIAEWGIGMPYSNELIVTTEKLVIKYDRVFSKPETYRTVAQIKQDSKIFEVKIGSDDQFVNLFRSIILDGPNNSINNSNLINDVSAVISKLDLA
jgi:dTDP-3,4-didehydro-2,6-dideoxy-alpha-D-glucose 3-reductase